MSGLLVKSTVIMKENLEEINAARPRRPLAGDPRRCCADPRVRRAGPRRALRRRGPLRPRRVRGAAADGRPGRARRGEATPTLPPLRQRRVARTPAGETAPEDMPARSDVVDHHADPSAAVLGRPGGQGHRAGDVTAFLDERALFLGQWGLKPVAGEGGAELVGAPRDRGPAPAALLARPRQDRGPARAVGRLRLLPVLERGRRPRRAPATTASPSGPASRSRGSVATGTCASPTSSGRGSPARSTSSASRSSPSVPGSPRRPAELFADNAYRDYLELHGLSVQLAEALAEYWHARVRAELGFAGEDSPDLQRAARPGLSRRAVLPRLRRLPRPRGPRQDRRPAQARSASASSSRRSSSCTPSSRRTRSSSTTPRRSTSTRDASRSSSLGHGRHPRRHRAATGWRPSTHSSPSSAAPGRTPTAPRSSATRC